MFLLILYLYLKSGMIEPHVYPVYGTAVGIDDPGEFCNSELYVIKTMFKNHAKPFNEKKWRDVKRVDGRCESVEDNQKFIREEL